METAVVARVKNRTPNRAARRARSGKGQRVGLTAEQVESRKTQLRGSDKYRRRISPYAADGTPRTFAPSDYWIDAHFTIYTDRTPDGKAIVYRAFDPAIMPAGFIRCPGCGHLSPPQLIGSSGHCMDCRFAYGPTLPSDASSISVVDMRALKNDREGRAAMRNGAAE